MVNLNAVHTVQLYKVTTELILRITEKIPLDPLQSLETTSSFSLCLLHNSTGEKNVDVL